MALIKCPECGKEISDKASSCPICGCPMNINKTGEQTRQQQQRVQQPISNKVTATAKNSASGLSIAGFVVALMSLLTSCVWTPIPLILMVVGFILCFVGKRDKKYLKKGLAIAGEIICIATLVSISLVFGGMNDKDSDKENEVNVGIGTEASIIYDENNCVITLKEGDNKTLTFEIENNSTKDYGFNVHSLAVNGIMTDCNIYTMDTDVPAGKKASAKLNISEYAKEFSDVEYADMILWAYDNAKRFKDFETGIIHIETNKYAGTDFTKKYEQEQEVNGLTVSLGKIENDKLIIYVKNNNDSYVEIDMENLSFNGWAYDISYEFDIKGIEIYPGCQAKLELDIDGEFLDESEISEISDCEFSLDIRENGDYLKSIESEKIAFKK